MAEKSPAQRRKEAEQKLRKAEKDVRDAQAELGEAQVELAATVTRDVPDFLVEALEDVTVSPPGYAAYTKDDGPFAIAGPEAMHLAMLGQVKIVGTADESAKQKRLAAEIEYLEDNAAEAKDVGAYIEEHADAELLRAARKGESS